MNPVLKRVIIAKETVAIGSQVAFAFYKMVGTKDSAYLPCHCWDSDDCARDRQCLVQVSCLRSCDGRQVNDSPHCNSLVRSSDLVPWIQSSSDPGAHLLEHTGWFHPGHNIEGWTTCLDGFVRPELASGKNFIWAPPPFAAEVAMAN